MFEFFEKALVHYDVIHEIKLLDYFIKAAITEHESNEMIGAEKLFALDERTCKLRHMEYTQQ